MKTNKTAKAAHLKKTGREKKIASPPIGASEPSFEEILRKKTLNLRIRKTITREFLKIKKSDREIKCYSTPYSYIYADFLRGPKYEKIIRSIENRLTDLGINGRIHRLSQFKNLEEIIEEDLRRGITTIVVLGDDHLIREAIEVVSDTNGILGIMPLGESNKIASFLGVPPGLPACDVLSSRRIEHLDVGRINGKIFFSHLSIFSQKAPIFCDNQYEIHSPGSDIFVYNLNFNASDKTRFLPNPKDGLLEVFVRPKKTFGFLSGEKKKESLFLVKELAMRSAAPFSLFVDGKKNFYKNIDVEIVPKKLKVIVGKNRMM